LNVGNKFSETAKNKVVILSTHIIEDIQSVCNRLVVLWGGRVIFDSPSDGLIDLADGHVGTCECTPGTEEINESPRLRITSKVRAQDKTSYRVVANELPAFVTPARPRLEDAYIYACATEEALS
jgi:ABC-type multidrug transport system ATPase subunit